MNETLIIGIIFILLCTLYGWARIGMNYKHLVVSAITGDPYDCIIHPKYEEDSKVVKLINGKYINTKNYIVAKIYGNHLSHRGVFIAEKWLVSPKEIPHLEDIVLIGWCGMENVYVLREVKNIKSEEIIVSRKNYEGKEIEEIYSRKAVIGVLKYCIYGK